MITVAKPTTVGEEKRKARADSEGQAAEDSGLQQEHKTEVTGELLVFNGRGIQGGVGRVSWRNQRGKSYSKIVCIHLELGIREDIQLS